MADILFSHSYYYPLDPKQWANKTPFPPLGTIYAASLMRDKGYQVALFDTNLLEHSRDIVQRIRQEQARYLVIFDDGFNYLTKMCLTNMREACFEMIALAKEQGLTVIVSSSDSTDHYRQYLEKGADFVLLGEGELTLQELIESLESGTSCESIQGIAWKNTNEVIVNSRRPVLVDLDSLPPPAWDLVDVEAYRDIWKQSGQNFTLNVATTRGCPYKCNWCAKPIYGNRYNSHSPEYVVNLLQMFKDRYGVNHFWMCDDIFGLKPNWVQTFNILLKAAGLKISFYMQSRVDLLLKEDSIEALAEAGLSEVWVGAESGSQKILDAMDKGTKVEEIYEATAKLKKHGIRVAFFLQFGYPGETREDIRKTIEMVKQLQPDNIGVSVSYPLPGTPFYDRVKDELKGKANWTDSDDLDLMFKGTFHSEFYRKLQRYVHKEYRKSQGYTQMRRLVRRPAGVNFKQLRSIIRLAYYLPASAWDAYRLKRLEHGSPF